MTSPVLRLDDGGMQGQTLNPAPELSGSSGTQSTCRWFLPARRDLWIIAALALTALLAVQSYAWPRSLLLSHRNNGPLGARSEYCSSSAPLYGLPGFEREIGSRYSRRCYLNFASSRGGIRLGWRWMADHSGLTREELILDDDGWNAYLSEPMEPTTDSIMTGGGCIVSYERSGWGGFAGEFDRYAASHRSTIRIPAGSLALERPAPQCGETHYWISTPIWPLAILPLLLLTMRAHARRRHWQRCSRGLCLGCGYDLRASADYCPECGRRR